MNTDLLIAWLTLSLAGCSFGGSSDDPSLEIDLESDAGSEARTDGGGGPPTTAGTGSKNRDAGSPGSRDAAAGLLRDARAMPVAPDAASADAGSSAGESCEAPSPVEVCDPVNNTGCPPLTQCDVDPTLAAPAGRCVLAALQLGLDCASDAFSTSCAPQRTCVAKRCRQPCRCDSDCLPGQQCRDDAAAAAVPFKLCADL